MDHHPLLAREPVSLHDLPPEVLELVLSNLDVRDITICRRVSRMFLHLIGRSIRLQYKMVCFFARVEDNPQARPELATLQRLQGVREWRRAFLAYRWSGSRRWLVPSAFVGPNGEMQPWKVAIGVFGPVFVLQVGRSLSVIQPPSLYRHREAKSWHIEDAGCQAAAFAYDRNEQVLVLAVKDSEYSAGYRLRFLSLTGKPHPSASRQDILVALSLDEDDQGEEIDSTCRLSVFVDLVLVEMDSHAHSDNFELWVFNWKTGRVLLHIEGSYEGYDEPSGAAFLDAHHLILPIRSSGDNVPERWFGAGLAVLRIPPHDQPHDTHTESRDEAVKRTVLFLELPEEIEGASYEDIRIKGHPPRTMDASDDIFSYQVDSLIYAVSFRIQHYDSMAGRPWTMAFPRGYILSLLPSSTRQNPMPTVVAWSCWAPHTRIFECSNNEPPTSVNNPARVVGSRHFFVSGPEPAAAQADDEPAIVVLDLTVKRADGWAGMVAGGEFFQDDLVFGHHLGFRAHSLRRRVGRDFSVGEDFLILHPCFPRSPPPLLPDEPALPFEFVVLWM